MELVLPILAILPAIILIVVVVVMFIGFIGKEGMAMMVAIMISSLIIAALLGWGLETLRSLGY